MTRAIGKGPDKGFRFVRKTEKASKGTFRTIYEPVNEVGRRFCVISSYNTNTKGLSGCSANNHYWYDILSQRNLPYVIYTLGIVHHG